MTCSATAHIERIVAFSSQQWLRERATVLHYTCFDYGFAWRRCRYVNQNPRLKFRWKMDRRRSHLTDPTALLVMGLLKYVVCVIPCQIALSCRRLK